VLTFRRWFSFLFARKILHFFLGRRESLIAAAAIWSPELRREADAGATSRLTD